MLTGCRPAITTPPAAHRELSIAALKAGKHVLCEKPFAMDEKEAAAMCDAAAASGRTAMVGHEFRHTPREVLDAVRESSESGRTVKLA